MLRQFLRQVIHTVVYNPLMLIFRNAPASVGGWDGRADADVCAQLTGAKADFWLMNTAECEDMIERQFTSRFTVLVCVAYFYIMWMLCACVWRIVCAYIDSKFIAPQPQPQLPHMPKMRRLTHG